MATEPDPPVADPDVLAGELAIGLLDGSDRAAALRRMLGDPGFARRVDDWRERLSPLDDEIRAIAPPGTTWGAIDRRLDLMHRGTGVAIGRWRAATLAMTALAAALLAVIVFRPPPAPPPAAQPVLVASLGAPSATTVLAVYEVEGGSLLVRPAMVDARNRVPELWVIPGGGKPVSLGVVARDRPTRVNLGARRTLLVRDAVLAISLEPVGGSPTGQPTGPIVAKGTLTVI